MMIHKNKYPAGFHRWLGTAEGQSIWTDFQKRACRMARLRKRYSAKAIAEVIRWDTALSGGDEFKLNNNWVPGLARKWLSIHGEKYPKFFLLRDPLGWDE